MGFFNSAAAATHNKIDAQKDQSKIDFLVGNLSGSYPV